MDLNEEDKRARSEKASEYVKSVVKLFHDSYKTLGPRGAVAMLNCAYILIATDLSPDIRKALVDQLKRCLKQIGSTIFEDPEDMKSFMENEVFKGK